MAPDSTNDDFYRTAPTFRDFRLVADEFSFSPLPDDWLIGVADVEQSTKAIQDNRYKAVNMAGAAVIAAIARGRRSGSQSFRPAKPSSHSATDRYVSKKVAGSG